MLKGPTDCLAMVGHMLQTRLLMHSYEHHNNTDINTRKQTSVAGGICTSMDQEVN